MQRFCHDHEIDKKSLLEKEKLGSIVKEEVLQVKVYSLLLLNDLLTNSAYSQIDFAIYLTFWDLSITNIVKNVLLS